jgi:hypothetical protein
MGKRYSHVVDTASDNVSMTERHAAGVDIDDMLMSTGDSDGSSGPKRTLSAANECVCTASCEHVDTAVSGP